MLVVYCASMAAAGPWDPWETHYGEVARQMNARHDPVDLWWQGGNGGPDGSEETTFWSKPALPFWAMALSMRLLGVGAGADPAEMVQPLWPELAIRLPSLLAGLGTAAFLGWVVARLASVRAGLITTAVLLTMPQWAIVTRQALTDMFFVGPVVLALGAWALAWGRPDRELFTRGAGWKRIPWDRTYLAFVVVLVLGAIVPLAVIHQHSYDPGTWDPRTWEALGRNKAYAAAMLEVQQHMFAYWAITAVVVLASLRWRRRSQAWMGILYVAAGLSLVGKGLIGPGLIGVGVLAHLFVSGRWRLLLRSGLPVGILLFVLASFPWHHAMVLLRGEKFVNELIIQNNLQRFGTGEQKQAVGGFSYYFETLGLAALPWSALAPLSIWMGLRAFFAGGPTDEIEADETSDPRRMLHRFAFVWLVVSLFVLSYSVTKYYHYLLPCLPPFAVLVGLWLDDALDHRHVSSRLPLVLGSLVGLAALVAIVRDAMHTPAWLAHLTTYLYTGMWTKGGPANDALIWTLTPFALGLLLLALHRMRLSIGALVLGGVLTTGWILGAYIPGASENWSQRTMMRTYFAERGPDDRIVSWWFYYRGETFLTKADIWVMKDVDRQALVDFVDAYAAEHAGQGASLWFATIQPHARRLAPQLPRMHRDALQIVHESEHYALLRLPIP
jgi:4-amino-4-deoxy-L-arabinose transferase-like glycosyltransferase